MQLEDVLVLYMIHANLGLLACFSTMDGSIMFQNAQCLRLTSRCTQIGLCRGADRAEG